MSRVMIVDDEPAQREMLAGFLQKKGFDVRVAGGGREAVDMYGGFMASLVVTDMKMPGMDGLELLGKLKGLNPLVQVIVLTAYGTVETAVAAMRSGAYGYLTKPVNLEELLISLNKAAEQSRLIAENDLLRRAMADMAEVPELIGDSEPMMRVKALISRVAPSDSSVLITGPSGSGKGLVANIIHNLSPRRDKAFVQLNCASLPETLLESELFGHEKGAFTGADRRRVGRFELADGGTIFLDEIGDMPAPMQAKLLRVLEDGSFEPLGSERSKKVDVRVISATNRALEELIETGKFRQDLFFRINTVGIELPPLHERAEDILRLAEHLLHTCARKMNKNIRGFSETAAARLVAYGWPGNVRELQNVIERAVVLSVDDVIRSEDLPGLAEDEKPEPPVRLVRLSEIEREHIERVLKAEGWNMQKTAEVLGIHRNTLRQKIKEYELSPDS
jgi:DNA-binding NtrC family response regulator